MMQLKPAPDRETVSGIPESFWQDGVVAVRDVLGPDWIELMRAAIDDALADKDAIAFDTSNAGGGGRFHNGFFHWKRHDAFRRLAVESPLPEVAATIMRAKSVRFFYDQLLVKEPGTDQPTPWHQDLSYWPVQGEQVLTLWVPLDEVDLEGGAVIYARGSHHENKLYGHAARDVEGMERVPDMTRSRYGMLAWNTMPGDLLAHHPLMLHTAGPNRRADRRRRAIAMRFVGDDARWLNRKEHLFKQLKERFPGAPQVVLEDGETLDHPMFPVVWPRPEGA